MKKKRLDVVEQIKYKDVRKTLEKSMDIENVEAAVKDRLAQITSRPVEEIKSNLTLRELHISIGNVYELIMEFNLSQLTSSTTVAELVEAVKAQSK